MDDSLAMPFAPSALAPLQQELESAGASAEAAEEAAIAVAHAVYSFATKADLDGSEFVPRHTDDERKKLAQNCTELAEHLLSAASGIDALKGTPIRGMYDAAYLLARQVGSERVDDDAGHLRFGEASSSRDSVDLQFASFILGEFLDFRKEVVVERYCWPYRLRELVRDVPHSPPLAVQRIFTDMAHDAEVLGLFFRAIGTALRNKRGRRNTGGREMFATCLIAWKDGTGALPTGNAPETGPQSRRKPQTPLYDAIKDLLALVGPPEPVGASATTFLGVLTALSDPAAEQVWREERRLPQE